MKTFYTVLLSLLVFTGYSQSGLVWQKSYGGTYGDAGYFVNNTSDGGIIISGISMSLDGDVVGNHGPTSEKDAWILKLDINGDTVWTKSLGGTRTEYGNMILETPDLGFIMAGGALSMDGDVWDHHGTLWFEDVWLVKLDANGEIGRAHV